MCAYHIFYDLAMSWQIMNSPKGVKLGVPEIASISCPTCSTRHDLPQITGHQAYVTVSEQTIQHVWHRGVKFVNKEGMYEDHRISEN